MKIMLVDDEILIVEGLKKILQKQYNTVEIDGFTNPKDALRSMDSVLPDLLITDIRMPAMTGLELIEEAKERGLKYYAILSGLDDVPLLQKSIRLEASDYLIKPVNKQELFSLVNSIASKCEKDEKTMLNKLARSFMTEDACEEQLTAAVDFAKKSEKPVEVFLIFLDKCQKEISFFEACKLYKFAADNYINNAMEVSSAVKSLSNKRKIGSKEITEVVNLVLKDYSKELILNDVAKKVFLQPNYLTTLFKKEMGIGFVHFVNQVRIDEACRKMLELPEQSFAEIANMCGFTSASHFFTTFKKYTDMTPGEFKSRYGE